MRKFILLFVISIPVLLRAQLENDSLKNNPTKLSDVIVYANKFPEHAKHVAQTVKVIRDKNTLNYQANTGDILINTGSLFVQKSQQGGSSPVIRGFEASRVLLMVDGVRMNNAIFRAGHLQNIITVDNMVLDRLEVLYGPSSTMYGSDALGGVINLYTKNPKLSNSKNTSFNQSVSLRYATAIEEQRGHYALNIGGKKWASLTAITYGSFGDITQGKNRNSAYPDFGKKNFIVERYGNTDSAFVNPNTDKQSPSDYKQIDVLQKILFQPKDNIQHLINIQYSNSTNVQRYDRLTEVASNAPVYAEWYYGPQLRTVIGYQFSATKLNGFFQDLKITTNYQDIEESRITRRYRNNNRDSRWERVNVFGFNADAKHYKGKNELHIGAESYFNFVRSTAERLNIASNVVSRITTRYSDGPTKMNYHALYAQHTYKLNKNWTLNEGLRLNAVALNAVFADTTLMHFPFSKATQNNVAVTGNAGVVYANDKNFRTAIVFSSGFRSPNVDDLTKVFDTKTGYVVVPNKDLKPEYTYNAEWNFNKYASNYSFGGSVFYTWFYNAIVVDKSKFNNQDSIIYQNIKSAVYAPQNKAKAYLYGFSVNASYEFIKNTTLDGVFTYTYGRYTNAGITMPLDHIPPTYGRVAIKHNAKALQLEVYSIFNGWKKMKDYNLNGEDNAQYATIDGMPSWFTINAKAIYQFKNKLGIQLQVENIADKNYRYFASGISAPGRNIVLSLRADF